MGKAPFENRATSVDVARLAGVAQSTVSRTFSDDPSITAATRAKVMAAARTLAYTPNALARSLITKQTNIVGIVMTNITSPFQPYVLEKFIRELQAIGRQALVFTAAPDAEVDDVLPLALQYQVDALIITSATLSSARVAACVHEGTPIILFNRSVPGAPVNTVGCDNIAGGRLVADRLLAAGHRRFAYIAGSINSSTNRDRERGFSDQLRLHLHDVRLLIREQAAYTYDAGCKAMARLLNRDDPPDAIFCGSDIIALGALDFARAQGIRVPDDLSIMGFDDIPMASWSSYALTTIRQPVDAMIAATLEILCDHRVTPDMEPVTRLFPGALIERASVRVAG